jgi:thioredoxin-disulfide reductase
MEDIYDLIILGGGPAGITAGIYAARHNLKTLLIANGFGGQMARKAVAIENYTGFEEISGFDLIQKFVNHLKKQNIVVKTGEVVGLDKTDNIFYVSEKNGDRFLAKAVILATGAEPKTLDIPGEKEFIGKGVSYCVACDGPIFLKKTVAVVGGGDAGFEAALYLDGIAEKIYILEYGKTVKADVLLQKKAEETKKIKVMTNITVKQIVGEKFVNSVIYQNLTENYEKKLDVQGIFVEIGNKSAVSFVGDLADLTNAGEIIVDLKNNMTKTAGLFAAGDVTNNPYKQIIISAGDGAKTALSAQKYIKIF